MRAGAENAAADMQRTVRHWADMLSSIMTLAYERTLGRKRFDRELRTHIDRVRSIVPAARGLSAREVVSDNDLYLIARRVSVRITFDLPPAVDMGTLNYLNNRGVISWRTYARYALRAAELDGSDLASTSDPFSADERKQMIMPKSAAGSGAGGAAGAAGAKKRKQSESGPEKK